MKFTSAALLPLAVTLLAAPLSAARAEIVCEGAYQIINGQPHATPYCQDENLAKVARSYGMRVSGEAMRSSPTAKARVCRRIGHDIRVKETCQNYREDRPFGRPF
jgi:hypothetical protein